MLSIVIPAFNEERRLPRTLVKWTEYLDAHLPDYEIVIADDGSADGTAAAVELFAKTHPKVRLHRLERNQGRGVAVREGVRQARGAYILETDADGSVDEEAVPRFKKYLDAHPEAQVLIGSRNLAESQVLTPQPLLRVLLGHGFMFTARALFGWDIVDYTLGFKMFRREAAFDVFSHQFDRGYLAEAELVFIARHRGWTLRELPILWTDYRDSRVNPLRDSLRSLLGLGAILKRKRRGLYDRTIH